MDTMANLFGSVDVFGSFDEAKSRARIQDGKEYVRNVVVSQETARYLDNSLRLILSGPAEEDRPA